MMLLTATVDAQDRKALDEKLQLRPPPVHLPESIHYSTWRKVCFKGSDGATLCRTTSTGTDVAGVVVVRVDLIERADAPLARLQLFVPQGLSVQAGVKVSVDQGAPTIVPYTFCLTNICIAAASITPSAVKEMEPGQTLRIEQTDFDSSPVTINIPLGQFAAAHNGPPAASYDFNLDTE
ncbi:invasion associated locus B family protein [Bradyrhizobium jicamae]|nr:invasion associated locus B family protein [Bradyrhizobium jicamae]